MLTVKIDSYGIKEVKDEKRCSRLDYIATSSPQIITITTTIAVKNSHYVML